MAAIVSQTAGIAAAQNTCDVTVTVGSGQGLVILAGQYNGSSGPGATFEARWDGGSFQAADASIQGGDGKMGLFVFSAPSAATGAVRVQCDAGDAANTHLHSVVHVVSGFDAAQMIKTSSTATLGGNAGGASQNCAVTTGVAAATGDIAFWSAVVRCSSYSSFAFNGGEDHTYAANTALWNAADNVFWGGAADKAGSGSTVTLGATGDSFAYAALAFVLKGGAVASNRMMMMGM